jgi:DNA replication protein DnaC
VSIRRGHLAAIDNSPEPACPFGRCDGSGWILDEHEQAHSCECRERRISKARTVGVATAIPKRFRGVGFDRPPISDMERDPARRVIVGAVRDYVENIEERLDEGRGLWLMGSVGTGKTSLAMLVAKSALAAGRTVAIYSVPQLLARIRRTYDSDPGEQSYLEFFERLTTVDLLHLDDLGSERRTDWVLEQLYAIVNRRYEEQLPIVVTMNDDEVIASARQSNPDAPDDWLAALGAQIGVRTVSRLVEICGDPLPVHGEDMRFRVAGP